MTQVRNYDLYKKFNGFFSACQEWLPLNNTDYSYVSSLARYGHTAVPFDSDHFLVFGGFTGQMKNDVLKFTLGKSILSAII